MVEAVRWNGAGLRERWANPWGNFGNRAVVRVDSMCAMCERCARAKSVKKI